MFDWLAKITIVCFAASYGICAVLEVSRLFFRAPIRLFVIIGFALAGLFAHTMYLGLRVRHAMEHRGLPLSDWQDWCLLAGWALALVYVFVSVRRPKVAIGVFLLPLILGLIGVGWLVGDKQFSGAEARTYWGAVHGAALLIGSVIVMLGAVAGIMYLIQSYRLKHKLPPGRALALPSLEWLQRTNEWSLVVSSLFLSVGVLSGIVLNLAKSGASVVRWTSVDVWSSAVLLLWLGVVLGFNFLYKPARRGRKVAYLVVASFVFLALALGIVIYAEHAATQSRASSTAGVLDGGGR